MYKHASEHQQSRTYTGSQSNRPVMHGQEGAERTSAEALATLEEQRDTLVASKKAAERGVMLAKQRLHDARRRGAAHGEYLPPTEYGRLMQAVEGAKLRCVEIDRDLASLRPALKAGREVKRVSRDAYHRAAAFFFLDVCRRRLSPGTFDQLMDEALMLAAAAHERQDAADWGPGEGSRP